MVIKETHNKQAASRKCNKSSSDRTLENIHMRLVAFERVHLVNSNKFFYTRKTRNLTRIPIFAMIGGVRMCDFCKNIYKSDYENPDYKDYIYKSEDGTFIHFTTGDSFMDFGYKINYCPICGRKVVEE